MGPEVGLRLVEWPKGQMRFSGPIDQLNLNIHGDPPTQPGRRVVNGVPSTVCILHDGPHSDGWPQLQIIGREPVKCALTGSAAAERPRRHLRRFQ
jgi:hypothetical protein